MSKPLSSQITLTSIMRLVLLLFMVLLWSGIYFFKDIGIWGNVDSERRINSFQEHGIRLADEPGASIIILVLEVLSTTVTPGQLQLTLGIIFCMLYMALVIKSKLKTFGFLLAMTPFFILQATNIQPFGIGALLVLLGLLTTQKRISHFLSRGTLILASVFFHPTVLVLLLLAFFRSRIKMGILLSILIIPAAYFLISQLNSDFFDFFLLKVVAYQGLDDPAAKSGLLKHLLLSIVFIIALFIQKKKFDRDFCVSLVFLAVILSLSFVSMKLTSRVLFLFDWWVVFLICEGNLCKRRSRNELTSV